uniref:Uncharacterized protein n=1 Tax=Acrobeloides nanus TaxID=290746 RepID=A0A914EAP1_9BILA
MTAYVSNWLTVSTYQKIFNAIDPWVYAELNCSTIGTNALGALTTSLTTAQYNQVLALGVSLSLQITPLGVANALLILKNILWNNVCYFEFQILTWTANNKANHTEEGVCANAYRMTNEFLTYNRTKTIMLRAKAAYVAAGIWTPIRNSAIGSWILFAQYGI